MRRRGYVGARTHVKFARCMCEGRLEVERRKSDSYVPILLPAWSAPQGAAARGRGASSSTILIQQAPPCGIGAFYRLFDLVSVSGTALLSCTLDIMSCSAALVVMPHSATSSVTGDDMSTMVDSNAGV